MLVRWGGEEFLLFIPELAGPDAFALAGRLLSAVSQTPILFETGTIHVTISAGYCPAPIPAPDGDISWESSIKIADAALYFSKKNGRNKAYGIDEPNQLAPDVLSELMSDFGAALAANHICAHEVKGATPSPATILATSTGSEGVA